MSEIGGKVHSTMSSGVFSGCFRQTSLDSFKKLVENRVVFTQKAKVFGEIERFSTDFRCFHSDLECFCRGISRREVHFRLGLETATVSARVNALLKEGCIEVIGVKRDQVTGKTVEVLALK